MVHNEACDVCGQIADLICDDCHNAFYCSEQCKQHDRKEHLLECQHYDDMDSSEIAEEVAIALDLLGYDEEDIDNIADEHFPTTRVDGIIFLNSVYGSQKQDIDEICDVCESAPAQFTCGECENFYYCGKECYNNYKSQHNEECVHIEDMDSSELEEEYHIAIELLGKEALPIDDIPHFSTDRDEFVDFLMDFYDIGAKAGTFLRKLKRKKRKLKRKVKKKRRKWKAGAPKRKAKRRKRRAKRKRRRRKRRRRRRKRQAKRERRRGRRERRRGRRERRRGRKERRRAREGEREGKRDRDRDQGEFATDEKEKKKEKKTGFVRNVKRVFKKLKKKRKKKGKAKKEKERRGGTKVPEGFYRGGGGGGQRRGDGQGAIVEPKKKEFDPRIDLTKNLKKTRADLTDYFSSSLSSSYSRIISEQEKENPNEKKQEEKAKDNNNNNNDEEYEDEDEEEEEEEGEIPTVKARYRIY